MREPEAVIAPLCLTNSNTMIVIAGDHHQVMKCVCVHVHHLHVNMCWWEQVRNAMGMVHV